MTKFRIHSLLCAFIFCCAPLSIRAEEQPKDSPPKMEVTSPAFSDNGEFPVKFTCSGSDINPPLEIKNVPAKTKSFALTVHDPDAPEGTWVHWVVYNMKPDVITIAENSIPGVEAFNDFGKFHYGGPCPSNDREHHYIFRAYALDKLFDLNEGAIMKDLEKTIKGHILDQAELTGVYRKPSW